MNAQSRPLGRPADPRQALGRRRELFHLLFREDLRTAGVVARMHDPLGPHVDRAAGPEVDAVLLLQLVDDGRPVLLQPGGLVVGGGSRGPKVTVVPEGLNRRQLAAGGEIPADGVPQRETLVRTAKLGHGLDAGGGTEFEGHERAVQVVAAPIAHRAIAELPPRTPLQGMQFVVVIAERHGADPLVPMQSGGHRFRGQPSTSAAAAGGGPAVDLGHVADRAGPDILAEHANVLAAVPLVAQLRHDFAFAGRLHHEPDFADAVGQRLLAVDVLAQLHGHDRGQGVVMIGDGDEDGVDVLMDLVEHLAIVVELLDAGRLDVGPLVVDEFLALRHVPFVHVAKGDELLVGRGGYRRLPLVDDADHHGAELGVGRSLRQHGRRGKDVGPGSHSGHGGGTLEELTTGDLQAHGISFKKTRREDRVGWNAGRL